jgi:hypothetical protein
MKLYEVEHINSQYNENDIMGHTLKFTHSIDSCNGRLWEAEKQPDDWDNVKRLTHMLFLAWNDKNPIEGVVYLGKFVKEKSEIDKFCDFFKSFNGFPINYIQKDLFLGISTKNNVRTLGRKCGTTTFLTTLAAWESLNNKKVLVVASNALSTENFYKTINRKCKSMGVGVPPLQVVYIDTRFISSMRGLKCDIILYDCHEPRWDLDWLYQLTISGHFQYTLATRTIDNEY